jgi:(p)ppGpp synthase/HD superfamily hydrolase
MPDPPLLGPRFDDALSLASKLHRADVRKGTTVPYLSHLLSVTALVLEDGGDEDEAIAALLHDALEDHAGEISAAELDEDFGPRVRDMVVGCTDTPPDFEGGRKPEWKARKEQYLADIRAGRVPVRVSLADKLHNIRCILRDHRTEGEAVWDRFSVSREQTLWYYTELARAYRDAGAEGYMIEEFERVVAKVAGRAGA